jgi:Popeye protein conserved region
MSMFEMLYPGGLVHIGALLYLCCFAFKNQIWLRSFAILGDLFYLSYYFSVADRPLWEAIFWNIPNILLNVVMISLLLRDNRMPVLEEDELLLFRTLKLLTPAQFKALLKGTVWQKSSQPVFLTEEGKNPASLYFVLRGIVEMEKRGKHCSIPNNTFIGEVAYLKNGPASARIGVSGESVIVKWPHEFLNRIFGKDEKLKAAFTSMMASDLASKLEER